jgi:hypothetical protein
MEMCQQWFSNAGLILDIVGFLMIAREWHWAINLQGAEQVERRANLRDTRADRTYRWKGWLQQYHLRRTLFRIGTTLVVLGFMGQSIGSLPNSYLTRFRITYIKSCS